MPDDAPQQLRIAVTLPSAASLGAYQAGAIAALLVAVHRMNQLVAQARRRPVVVVDAMGAASAGALSALLATRCLMSGVDPVHVLHRAWVQEASWGRLRRGAHDAPLSLAAVERRARDVLDPRDRRGRLRHRTPSTTRQSEPVVLHLEMGSLQALTFPIPGSGPVLEGLTHVDESEFVLRRDDGLEAWTCPSDGSPLDVALAGMSHPAVFAPRLLDRTRERERYRARGITNLPASGRLWCSDGGALVRNPLAGTLAAARRAEQLRCDAADAEEHVAVTRIHLLVHPHTAGPDGDGRWTDPDQRPRWTASLSRVVASLDTESLYADQRRIEEVNTRIRRADELVEALAPSVPDDAAPALLRLLQQLQQDEPDRPALTGPVDVADVRSLLRSAVHAVAATTGREPVATEVVSPLRLLDEPGSCSREQASDQEAVPSLLAGEFLGRFGGLLGRDLRQSDFVTGWRSARAWLADGPTRYGVPDDDVAEALAAVDAREIGYGRAGHRGGAGLSDVRLRNRAQLAATVVHAARVAVQDALAGRS